MSTSDACPCGDTHAAPATMYAKTLFVREGQLDTVLRAPEWAGRLVDTRGSLSFSRPDGVVVLKVYDDGQLDTSRANATIEEGNHALRVWAESWGGADRAKDILGGPAHVGGLVIEPSDSGWTLRRAG